MTACVAAHAMAPSSKTIPHSRDKQCCSLLTAASLAVHAIHFGFTASGGFDNQNILPEVADENSAQQTTKGRMKMTFHERYLAGCAALAVAALITATPTRAQDAAALNAEAAQK